MVRTASGAFWAMVSAILMASGTSSSAGTTLLRKPISLTRSAGRRSAVITSSSTLEMPIILVSSTAKGGIRLHLVSVMPKRASSAARRTSHIWAMDQPPAAAAPLTAATKGLAGRSHMCGLLGDMLFSARACTPSALSAARSFRSRPAQKLRPAPVMTATQASSSSLSKWSITSRRSRRNCRLMALEDSGRLSVITATWLSVPVFS